MASRRWLEGFLRQEEGFEAKPYRDTQGKLTIGYGRNLDDHGISEGEARVMLMNDVDRIASKLAVKPWWPQAMDLFDEVRQDVLIAMGYQLGLRGLCGFRKMIAALMYRRWRTASQEMLDSEWARQTPERARRLATMMQTGVRPAL